jgi:pimeloyl-ACP methyl ester carboxylesterase
VYEAQTPSASRRTAPVRRPNDAAPRRLDPRSRRLAWGIGAVGAALAGAAVANHLIARQSERRHPPTGRFVTADGIPVHYLDRGTGTGPTIVLIHGNGVIARDWELSGVLGRLAARHRVIAFDRPGFGYTPRPRGRPWTAADQAHLILAALERLGVEDVVLVGHSWGTLVSLQAALQRPRRVRGLVLMSGYYWPTARLDIPIFSGPAIPGVGDVLRFTIGPPLGWLMTPTVFKTIFAPAQIPPRFKREFPTSMILRPSQLRASAADTAMLPHEAAKIAERLGEITAPVLVMAGDEDKVISFERESKRLARELPGARLRVIEGGGHMIHHIAPDVVAGAIESFLGQLGAEPTSKEASGEPAAAPV